MSTMDELMEKYAFYEQMQTEHSRDEDFYKFCQRRMDEIDIQADELTRLREGDG